MTATVAAVVIFLCGVMVGRGVNTTRASAAAAVTAEPTVDPTSRGQAPLKRVLGYASSGEPVSSQEDLKELTYARRLEAPEPPPEPAVEPVAARLFPRSPSTKAQSRPQAVPTRRESGGPGRAEGRTASWCRWLRFDRVARPTRSRAASRRRDSPPSSPRQARAARRCSASASANTLTAARPKPSPRRLEKEEQFKPWITR